MKVNLLQLMNAANNIKVLTNDIKSTQYIMLDFMNDKIQVCYSDGKISYIEKIDGESESGDIYEKAVVELDALLTKLDVYSPSAGIEVDPLSLKLDGMDGLILDCNKFMNQIQLDEDGEMIDDGNGEALTVRVDAGHFNTKLKYHKCESSARFSMTTQMNYDAIFEGDEWVTCGVTEFKNLLTKLSRTDGARDCYLSPKRSAGFSIGTGYTVFLPIDFNVVTSALHLSSVKKLSTILSKLSVDTINLLSENSQFTKITTDDGKVGIVFEQCAVVRQSIVTLASFEAPDYTTQGVMFNKAVLADMVRGVLLVSGNEIDTELAFSIHGDKVMASIVKKGSGNGIDNLNIYAHSVNGDISNFNDFKMNISFKLLDIILKSCDGNAVQFDIAHVDEDNYLRISDLSKSGKEISELGYYYLTI